MITDQALLEQIQYAVMEPPDNGLTWPSGLWSQTEVLTYLSEQQRRFGKAALLQMGSATIAVAAGVHRVALPDDWLATVSVIWTGTDGIVRELTRSDTFEADHGLPSWTTTRATPQLYMDYETPTLQIQLAPLPDVDGTIEVVYAGAAPVLDGTGDPLMVPDEFAPAVKYGILASMFEKDGRGHNSEKAAYCAARAALGLDIARILLRGGV